MARVLDLHPCDSGSNPTVSRFYFFFYSFFFFFFFFCLSRIRDTRPERVNQYQYSKQKKFHVHQSHSFREKCNDNLQIFKVVQLS